METRSHILNRLRSRRDAPAAQNTGSSDFQLRARNERKGNRPGRYVPCSPAEQMKSRRLRITAGYAKPE
jgi:hypothetical protein